MAKSHTKKIRDLLVQDAIYASKNLNLSNLKNSSVFITGSTGLVGVNLLMGLIQFNELNKQKIEIYAQHHTKLSQTFKDIFNYENVKFIKGDITDKKFIDLLPNFDSIIHSAGYAQPGRFMANKLKTFSLNTRSTECLFQKLKKRGNFLYLSSAEIYSGSSMNCTENDIGSSRPDHPRSCYIEGKRGGEAIVNIFREEGYNAVSARLALAYGPGPRKDDLRVLNQLIQKGLKGNIDLMDSGSAMRTYCYISDVTRMLLNLLNNPSYGVYNVGGKSQISIKQLAQLIAQKLNVDLKIPKKDSFLSEAPKEVGLNLNRIEKEFLINDYITLEKGIDKTIEWFKLINKAT